MAITGTDFKIDTSMRDSLDSDMGAKSDAFVGAVGGGASTGGFLGIGASTAENIKGKAGITSNMVEQIRSAYDSYIETINNDIAQIENPAVNEAFKGSAIEGAFQNLVSQVKMTAQAFTKTLQEAEMSIIDGVKKAYESQDTAISGDIKSDTGTLGQ